MKIAPPINAHRQDCISHPTIHIVNMILPLWFLLILLTISLLVSLSKILSSRSNRLPPGPAPLPIIGNLFDLRGTLHLTLARLAKIYGPVVSLKLGFTTTIIVSSAEIAREVMQEKDQLFSSHWVPDAFHALDQHESWVIWLPATSPYWKQLRSIWSMYLLSPSRIELSRPLRDQKAREILDHIGRQEGRTLDIGRVIFSGFFNLISSISFSENVIDLNSESRQEFKDTIRDILDELAKKNISDLYPFLGRFDLQGARRRIASHLTRLFCFFDDVMDRRLNQNNKSGNTNGDFLDSLLKLISESKLDRQQARNILTEVFLAGVDTNSTTVVWAFAELLRNPGSMEKVRNELREAIGSQELEESDLVKLPYLQAVVKESIRMHPTTPIILPRLATQDGVELGGFDVPKGARVIINAWAIGRDPAIWPEPDVFKPERFLEKVADTRGPKLELITFGFGRRGCPGMPLALRLVPFILGLMIQKFNWSLPDGMKAEDLDLTETCPGVLDLAVPLRAVPMRVVNN